MSFLDEFNSGKFSDFRKNFKNEYNIPEEYHGYKIKLEEQYGGEGQGEEYWYVFSAEKDGKVEYYQINGCYYSYDGATLDTSEIIRVEKSTKVVEYWREV